MIPDKQFKQLAHFYTGFETFLKGESLQAGYNPDFVLKKNEEYIILESENSSSRKSLVGGLIKAAHFFQAEKKGILVFIIVPKSNTNASAIAKHLKRYLNWIKSNTNLRDVFVIEANLYYSSGRLLKLDCEEFYNCAIKV